MLFEDEYGSDVFQYEMDMNNKIIDSYLWLVKCIMI
jgi:hypothetical protein